MTKSIPKSSIVALGLLVLGSFQDVDCMSMPAPKRLRQLLQAEMDGTRESEMPLLLPCCYDGLTARLVARAGFEITFMTGFGVSAANGFPDTQLISYKEMQSSCLCVAEALSSAAFEMGKDPIPCIADGKKRGFQHRL